MQYSNRAYTDNLIALLFPLWDTFTILPSGLHAIVPHAFPVLKLKLSMFYWVRKVKQRIVLS